MITPHLHSVLEVALPCVHCPLSTFQLCLRQQSRLASAVRYAQRSFPGGRILLAMLGSVSI
jgi:hypothetical protein